MIGAGMPPVGQDFARERAEAALHAVADDRAADLLGDGEADALGRIAVAAIADEQDETRRRRAPAGVGGEEIRRVCGGVVRR